MYIKTRQRQRGRAQYHKLGAAGPFHRIGEGPCSFLVNFTDYLDTGLFLDHRITRSMVRTLPLYEGIPAQHVASRRRRHHSGAGTAAQQHRIGRYVPL